MSFLSIRHFELNHIHSNNSIITIFATMKTLDLCKVPSICFLVSQGSLTSAHKYEYLPKYC